MKRSILFVILTLCISSVFAQKSNVSKAKNKALTVDNPDFNGARELIKSALENPESKDNPDTWYVAGLIGFKENEAFMTKMIFGQDVSIDQKGQAVMSSYRYFLVADSLGQIPNEKGKINNKVRRNIKQHLKFYFDDPRFGDPLFNNHFVSYGANLFNQNKYKEAYEVFNTYISIPMLEMMQGEKFKLDTTYSQVKELAATAAMLAEQNDRAEELFKSLIQESYHQAESYRQLYNIYSAAKDSVKMLNTLETARRAYPQDLWFLNSTINYYLFGGNEAQALAFLNEAIAKDPNEPQYHLIKGQLEEKLGHIDDAFVSFDNAVKIAPDMADAWAGKGRVLYNKGFNVLQEADKIPANQKAAYEKEKARAKDFFQQSLPFYQKTVELAPKDVDYKKDLRRLYYNLDMDSEYQKIDEEIKAAAE